MNGALWGGFAGLFAYGLYENIALAMVLMISMLLGFIVAAAAGFWIPLLMQKLGRDPALGATVVLDGGYGQHGIFHFSRLGRDFFTLMIPSDEFDSFQRSALERLTRMLCVR